MSTPRPLVIPEPTGDARVDALRTLLAIVDRLRASDGCPWDLKQTLESVAPHLIEESHELLEAIETAKKHEDTHIVEEAGDLLMGILLLARIAQDDGRFDLARVAGGVCEKLVRRHPHVFGDAHAADAEAALSNWEAIKRAERAEKAVDSSALAGAPLAMPALQRAKRLGEKAMSVGFRWVDARGAISKLREELEELESAFEAAEAAPGGEAERLHLEHELGDVMLAAAFLGNYVALDPERAARLALRRFEARFRSMEQELARPLQECSLAEMMAAWGRAKVRVG
ncbi:MAG TPA: nucleoside triphosphate pyrophosphohydrolase [Planctomycetota bacterium]|nr:nucleoside triphosphate pyrophosphohydrolase [Planctomycetota bacterium]